MSEWSAQQYVKFEDERTRPARDLLARVSLAAPTSVVDIGCGPGNSTALLRERFASAQIIGMDSSPAMLTAARQRLLAIEFREGDIATWRPPAPVDFLFANAVFQWVPEHERILVELLRMLRPGGILALQMPDNLQEPTHLLMQEVARLPPFVGAYQGREVHRARVLAPARYYDLLCAQAASIDIWHTIYNHVLANAAAIVDWMKGTGLLPYLEPLSPQQRADYLAEYERRVAAAYLPLADGRVLLRFPRLFIVITKRD